MRRKEVEIRQRAATLQVRGPKFDLIYMALEPKLPISEIMSDIRDYTSTPPFVLIQDVYAGSICRKT